MAHNRGKPHGCPMGLKRPTWLTGYARRLQNKKVRGDHRERIPGSVSADCSDNSCRPIKALRTGRHLVDTSISSTPASTAQAPVTSVNDGASKPEPKSDRDGATRGAPASSATVTLSPAAQAAQEAAETPEQTAREARGNDRQAQQLVAKQAAVAKMYASS